MIKTIVFHLIDFHSFNYKYSSHARNNAGNYTMLENNKKKTLLQFFLLVLPLNNLASENKKNSFLFHFGVFFVFLNIHGLKKVTTLHVIAWR